MFDLTELPDAYGSPGHEPFRILRDRWYGAREHLAEVWSAPLAAQGLVAMARQKSRAIIEEQAAIRLLHSQLERFSRWAVPTTKWKLGECAETEAANRLFRLLFRAARRASPEAGLKEWARRVLDAYDHILDALVEYRTGVVALGATPSLFRDDRLELAFAQRLLGQLRKLRRARAKDWSDMLAKMLANPDNEPKLLTALWRAATSLCLLRERRTGKRRIIEEYRGLAEGRGLNAARRGDAAAALAKASQVLEAEFTFPYLAHAPMEPLNAIIELRPDGAEIWSGCQTHSADAHFAAKVLGFTPEQVRINTLLGGGSFGRRGTLYGGWASELAEIAKAVGGRAPVHVVWTREDDIRGGYYRPLTLHRVKVGLDAVGQLSGWEHKLVCQSLVEGTPLEKEMAKDGFDRTTVGGLADTPYDIPDFSVEFHSARSPVPVHSWRSVAHSHTAHAIETMLDELARRTGRDPVAFRRTLLAKHPRDLVVLDLAAEKAAWGRPTARHRGRGIAYHRSFDTRVAMVAEVTMSRTSYRVDRIVCAVDCGVAVNPDIIEAQIEGAVGFALSSVLRNAITLDKGAVEQTNFDDYDPTRFSEMPKVEVHIVKSLEAPSGIGEPGVPPLAPAIGNAIAAATGKRLYSLPFDTTLLQ